MRRGRGGKGKEWTNCVQSDIRAFGITGDWRAMASKAEMWVEAVTEGGRRFMASWRKERAAWGGGGALSDFFVFVFPYSADHEWDWPPCKVDFSGWRPIINMTR